MLFAGWEVRMVKNCDRGLENVRGRRPRAAFSNPRSQFFPIRTDPKAANNTSCRKLAYKFFTCGFVYVILPLNWLTRRLQYKPFAKNLTSKRANKSNTLRRKMN